MAAIYNNHRIVISLIHQTPNRLIKGLVSREYWVAKIFRLFRIMVRMLWVMNMPALMTNIVSFVITHHEKVP